MGFGFGIGQGYSDCERVFNPAAVPGFVIAGQDKAAPSPYAQFNPFSTTSSKAPEAPSATAIKEEVVEKAKDVKDAVVGKAKDVEAKVVDKKMV